MISIILKLTDAKASRKHSIPREVLKAGLNAPAGPIHHLVLFLLVLKRVPREVKDVNITTLYTNGMETEQL